ncbi:MAG: hypothetical protein LPK07_08760 [Hymenobacteraceae bacterium]|nr:hypothetical protein [Hymenobacteraceae bacterium]MDX5481760.1 hypothetical protein [Hymenobacteraceae bacterium]
MKKVTYAFALVGLFSFASCNSPAEEKTRESEQFQEEMEDEAAERAEAMEEMQEVTDTSAVIE